MPEHSGGRHHLIFIKREKLPPKIKFEAGLISPRLEDSVFNEAKAILAQ